MNDFGAVLARIQALIRDLWLATGSTVDLVLVGDIIGTLGMTLVVFAYLAIEKGWFSRSELRYYVVNLVGALLLLLSLLISFNLGSFIIELFWIAISLMGILRCLRNRGA